MNSLYAGSERSPLDKQLIFFVLLSIPAALAVGLLAVLRPTPTLVGIGVVGVAALAVRRGVYPIAIVFVWFSAVGTGLDSGLLIGGANVPVGYILIAGLGAASAIAASGHLHSDRRRPATTRSVARCLAVILAPALLFSLLGIAGGNSPSFVREEALLWAVAALMATITLLSLRTRDVVGLSSVFLLAATVAALKTILIQISGTLVAIPGFLQAYSAVNPQFGVQRVIPVGGDTLMVLGIPVATGLLRVVRGKALMVVLIALSIDALGLGLTYTRSLIVAAALGAFVALAVPIGVGVRRMAILVRMGVATAAITVLLSFTFGQSDLSAGQALVTRFVGGQEVGASSLQERLDDAKAALGGGNIEVILLGRGIGASYFSPVTPYAGQTAYVHSGYPWLIMQGGIPLALLVIYGLFFAMQVFWKQAPRANGTADSAFAGLAGSVVAFAATNLLINRFASVEGAAFMGVVLASALLFKLTRPEPIVANPSYRLDAAIS